MPRPEGVIIAPEGVCFGISWDGPSNAISAVDSGELIRKEEEELPPLWRVEGGITCTTRATGGSGGGAGGEWREKGRMGVCDSIKVPF